MRLLAKTILWGWNKVHIVFYHFLVNPFKRSLLRKCGQKVSLEKGCKMDWHNVEIGNDVHIGEDNRFMCTGAPIIIGNHVMFGPDVTLITGNHRIDIIGKYMTEVGIPDKRPEDDLPIIIKGDNWIGAGTIILKGVEIGVGSVVAAGAVVSRNVPPYSIVGGVPAKVISYRFDEKQIAEHEKVVTKNG